MSNSEFNANTVEYVPGPIKDETLLYSGEKIAEECARNVFEFDMTEHDNILLEKSKWRRIMNRALKDLVSNDAEDDVSNYDAEDDVQNKLKKIIFLLFGYLISILSYIILGMGMDVIKIEKEL